MGIVLVLQGLKVVEWCLTTRLFVDRMAIPGRRRLRQFIEKFIVIELISKFLVRQRGAHLL